MTLKNHNLNDCVSTPNLPPFLSATSSSNNSLINNGLPAVWKDFLWGMYNLQKYISRTNEDPHKVARSNLKLLHASLCTTSFYKENTRPKKKQYNTGTISHQWIPLVNTSEIKGGIFTLTNARALEINFHAADNLILKNHKTSRAKIDDNSCQHYHMLLVIQGKIQIRPVSLVNTFENSPIVQYTVAGKLNKGDTHLEYIGPNTGINIESVTPNSQILSVKLLHCRIANPSITRSKTFSRVF